jgi:hypothetical protein
VQEALPPPMTPGNHARATSTCQLQLAFEKVRLPRARPCMPLLHSHPASSVPVDLGPWALACRGPALRRPVQPVPKACPLCHSRLPQVVVAHEGGWEWKNERPQADPSVYANAKWGWIGTQPGSWAELEVDTTSALQVRRPPCREMDLTSAEAAPTNLAPKP